MMYGIFYICLLLVSLCVVFGVIYPLIMSVVWLIRWRGVIPYKQYMKEI